MVYKQVLINANQEMENEIKKETTGRSTQKRRRLALDCSAIYGEGGRGAAGGEEEEERFHGTLSKRSEGHRLSTTGITQFQRYVRKKGGGLQYCQRPLTRNVQTPHVQLGIHSFMTTTNQIS